MPARRRLVIAGSWGHVVRQQSITRSSTWRSSGMGAADLKAQAAGPVQASVEMNATPDRVLRTLNSMTDYVVMFGKAFPNDAVPVTLEKFAKAIEAFEAALITPAAPFDQYLEGDEYALSDQQKAGLKPCIEKGCSCCHNGINIGGQDFFPFGAIKRPAESLLPREDKGRFAVTRDLGDEYVSAQPRCVTSHCARPTFILVRFGVLNKRLA